MISLTKCPVVTFSKISRDNVRFLEDVKAIERCYGRSLKVKRVWYGEGGDLSGLTVSAMGRMIDVDITLTGVEYTLQFHTYDYTPQYEGTDAMFIDRVR
jgi:hypothetical protein